MFNIYLSSQAKRFLSKSQKDVCDRIIKKIKTLCDDPFPPDTKRVVGIREKVFRARVGDFRIQYVVFYDENEILITEIEKRERAY